ncbi:MAG: lipoprotein [Pseudomonadota bacterium]
MRTRLTTRLLLLVFAMVLAGCGQKGPLYLPDKQEPSAGTGKSESPDS